ncbi:MAG: ABC-2 transporter permease [Elusimicrobia bacterium]|nr:ABC-2 transporter permease [Elusimicrobiota bacterium]
MKGFKALFLKETRAYFNTPTAYIIAVVFLFCTGYFSAQPMFVLGQASVSGFLDLVPLLLTFFVPAITMRLFSEEQKAGTIELLQTLPVEDHEIVLSKYAAAVTLLWSLLALTLGFPVALGILGNLDWGATLVGYAGLALAAAMLAAVGLFASAMTRNQVVAFIVGWAGSFALYALGKVDALVPPWLSPFTDFMGLDAHIHGMARGVIDTRDLIYFASFGGVFLFLTLVRLWVSRTD